MGAAKAPTPTDITCPQCTKATGRQAETGGKRQGLVVSGRGDLVLGDLMHDVSRLRRLIFDGSMRPLGLTRSQWWVLDCLSRSDGMIQSDLANTLGLGNAALGGSSIDLSWRDSFAAGLMIATGGPNASILPLMRPGSSRVSTSMAVTSMRGS